MNEEPPSLSARVGVQPSWGAHTHQGSGRGVAGTLTVSPGPRHSRNLPALGEDVCSAGWTQPGDLSLPVGTVSGVLPELNVPKVSYHRGVAQGSQAQPASAPAHLGETLKGQESQVPMQALNPLLHQELLRGINGLPVPWGLCFLRVC